MALQLAAQWHLLNAIVASFAQARLWGLVPSVMPVERRKENTTGSSLLLSYDNERLDPFAHGVVVDGQTDRYSLAYFHSPNPYRVIEVLPACIAADRPAKYAPALYADLVLEFFRANYAHQQGHGTAAMPNRYARRPVALTRTNCRASISVAHCAECGWQPRHAGQCPSVIAPYADCRMKRRNYSSARSAPLVTRRRVASSRFRLR